jgi:hypothetical protein
LAAACGRGNEPRAKSGGDADTNTTIPGEPSAFPAEDSASRAPADEGAEAEAPNARNEVVPAPAAAPRTTQAPASEKKSSGSGASADSRPRRPIQKDDERPGLGTTWGETRSSHVSNAPFERGSSNPFALTTIRYNDANGIAAMLRGGSFVNVAAEAAPAASGLLTVRLLDETGAPLPTFMDGGRTLVQGEHGSRYVIEVANRSSSRFEAVVSVDGLDVVDGQPGAFSKRGYLIQPFATVEIDGFRQSMDAVAAFRFGSVRGSYASRKGNDRNVGVIGVAFFAERGAAVWTERELVRRESADPFPGRFASPPIAR